MNTELKEAILAFDLPSFIACHWPDSGARPDRVGTVRAVWRNEKDASFSLFRARSDQKWLFTDHGEGQVGNSYGFLVDVLGYTSSEAADVITGRRPGGRKTFHSNGEEKRLQAEREERAKAASVARDLKRFDKLSRKGTSDYLQQKGLKPTPNSRFGSDTYGDYLAQRVVDVTMQGRGLQKFYKDKKRFTWGMRKSGGFIPIGSLEGCRQIYVVEGYTTGITVHLATGSTTVCALDADNLAQVVSGVSATWPRCSLTIVADVDLYKDKNVGLDRAWDVAERERLDMYFPDFTRCDQKDRPSDFDDLRQLAGLAEVRRQLLKAPPGNPFKCDLPVRRRWHQSSQDVDKGARVS